MTAPPIHESPLDRVRLGVRPGVAPSARPPVRIFVGTEPAQRRAERVLVWSIERVRDPSRVYEIWLLEDLSGFRRDGWTTGFTNYRFAIPELAGGGGRAVYNDVDQIYLADPGELFDLPLGPHGFLAVASDDASVMLLDCARMAKVWTREAARTASKAVLLRRALAEPDGWGALPPEWNARDGEYAPGRSKLLHYTTLHTQPWRPFPRRFAYQASEHAELWHALEAEADAAGFRLFTRERPSARYRALASEPPLEQAPDADLPWRLDELFAGSGGELRLELACAATPRCGAAPEQARTPAWWSERLERAAAAHPGVRWEAVLRTPDGGVRRRAGGPRADGSPPRVWVLADDRAGNTTQSIGLAEALGWAYERKDVRPGPLSKVSNRLLGASLAGIDTARSSPLEPPWPDLVIAAGRRTAPVALWIAERSGGLTRLVHLGRKGGDDAERFDLVATPRYCNLFPHPHRVETEMPLHRVGPAKLAEAAARWRERFAAYPAPRIALLVGGTSGQYRLDAAQARRLGEELARMARERGGSILATTSRRTTPAATAALCEALGPTAFVHRAGDPGENPYLGLLALADLLVVTGDSESMLAEAAATGKPLVIYPLAVRASFRLLRGPRDLVLARARAKPPGSRGTPRPQRGLERLCGRLIERGFVRPTRDLDRLHARLVERGLAHRVGEAAPRAPAQPLGDLDVVVARVHRMLGIR
jgi:mitochondrial fission protein ELM1